MSEVFWTNTVWYILLFISSVVTLGFALKKSRHRRFTVAFTAATLGLVFYIESVLVILLNAYDYHPMITPGDQFQDTVFGNLFSQISISSTSAFALVFSLSYVWYGVFAVVYFLIELLFVRLGLYELHTYKSVYTLIGFIPLFILIRLWYKRLIASPKKLLHNAAVLLGTNAVLSVLLIMPLKVFDIQIFSAHIFDDASKDHTSANLLYGLVLTPVLMLLFNAKMHWAYKVCLLGILVLLRYALFRAGFITVVPGWFFPIALFEYAGRYGLIVMFDGFLKRKPTALEV